MLGRLLELPAGVADDSMRAHWSELLGQVPELPMASSLKESRNDRVEYAVELHDAALQ